jgi:cobalamin synthase
VSAQWRQFLAALRFFTHRSASPPPALRYVPLAGIAVGLAGAAVYWGAARLWPASIAVTISMLATALLDARSRDGAALYWVFVLLVKFNALMALSAASVPIALPANLPLGLIMTAAHAVSAALLASVLIGATPGAGSTPTDLGGALLIGLAPAAFLGIPGLIGLAAAILMRMALGRLVLPRLGSPAVRREVTRRVTEICFYLGALAAWEYV